MQWEGVNMCLLEMVTMEHNKECKHIEPTFVREK
jgi:hypothetical protein